MLRGSSFIAGSNIAHNTLNLAFAGAQKLEEMVFQKPGAYMPDRTTLPSFQDPLIKHSVFELIAPPIAIDRVARGLLYLRKHTGEFIESQNSYPRSRL